MSYTYSGAKIEVARTIGGQNDADELFAAGVGINKAIRMWNREHVWDFLHIDNTSSVIVASATTIAVPTVTLPTGVTFPNFENVYVGATVSGAGIPAGATVIAKTGNSALTLSIAATATADPVTLTFSGYIPIRAGVRDYPLPFRMVKPSWARVLQGTTSLIYVRSRTTNKMAAPESDGTGLWGYTFMPVQAVANAQGVLPLPTTMIRVYDTPTAVDQLLFEGFRAIQIFQNDLSVNDEARPLDVPEDFEDDLLELAAYFYQNNKDSEVARTQDKKQNATYFLRRAIARDLNQPDEDLRFLAPDEVMLQPRGRGLLPWEF